MTIRVITLLLVLLPLVANAQIQNAEMTVSYEDRQETLIAEEGNFPPDTDVSSRIVFGRLRLQDMRRFPLFEVSYKYDEKYGASNLIDARFAALYPVLAKKLYVKALYVQQNPDAAVPTDTYGTYLFGSLGKLNLAAGLDYSDMDGETDKIYSLRAKYKLSIVDFMAGISSRPDDQERYVAGGLIDLPAQFLLGGLVGIWEDETGWSVNFGRFNKRGDFEGLPSFALNYLEVPMTYKWTNFRIMWGDAGIHYVKPTFDNPVFSGMLDLDVALMLKQLMPDNYRHFDSPLLFKRYDEYGKVAFRINYIETETNFRRVDANISANPGLDYGALKGNRLTLTYDRMHNPVFGWQDTRYHATFGSYLFGKVYSGITYSSDFNEYENLIFEFRVHATL